MINVIKLTLPLLCLGFFTSSCNSDDDNVISANELPTESQAFVSDYYPSATITKAEEDEKYGEQVYEVELSDGTDIDFNEAGEWIEVEADDNQTVSDEFLMAEVPTIYAYIDSAYTSGVESIEYREGYGYEVELTDDLEILFDVNENYLSSSYGDLDITSNPVELPVAAQEFITSTYPNATVSAAYKDVDDGVVEYEVTLDNGVYIEFDGDGNWDDIDAEHATAGVYIPATILPQVTQDYLLQNYKDAEIVEVEIEMGNYEVEITTLPKSDLVFNSEGEYIRTDSSRK